MILKNMRWGYDGGGCACGPVDGNYLVEAMVNDESTKYNYFVLCSHFADGYKMEISEMPIFDVMMHAFEWDVNFEHEFAKLRNVVIEDYDFERLDQRYGFDEDDEEAPTGFALYDCPEMFESKFASAIKLTLKAMEELCSFEDPDDADVMDFAEDYLDENLDNIEIEF